MTYASQFAAETAETHGDIFSALGINWQLLIFQIVAFLLLVWLLGKFVYPWLMKQVDERQQKIDDSVKAADEAKAKAASAEEDIAKLLTEARSEASDIVATAKEEATAAIEAAEEKAKTRAEAVVAAAHEQVSKDVVAAKKALRDETIELVALATEKVVAGAVDSKVDGKVIAAALKEGAQ